MASSLAADRGILPVFVYHPDPVGTGSVALSDVGCVRCRQQRGFAYVGPVYAVDDLDGAVCPWCIADGSAAEMFDAQFTDALWRVPDDVSAEATEVVLRRTPGFTGWQQERWLHHCGDAAEFHGLAGWAELRSLPDAVESLRSENTGFGWTTDQLDHYLQSLTKEGQPTAYLFQCRHCSTHLAYSDFT